MTPRLSFAAFAPWMIAAACSAAPSSPRLRPSTSSTPPSDSIPSTSSELPVLAPSRTELAPPLPTPLAIANVLPVWGDDTAVFVSQFAGDRTTYFQRVDGEHGRLGEVVTLTDENVFAAFARGTDLTIASTHDASVCLTTYRGADVVTRGCETKSGTVLLPLGDGFVVLAAETPDPDADPRRPGEPAQKTPRPKPPPPKKPKPAKPGKRRAAARPEPKVAADPKKLSLDRQLVTVDGALEGEREPSGLTFTAPMTGMDLVTGTSNGGRARVLYYEFAGTVKNGKTGVIGKAHLTLGSLDDTGAYDDTSRSAFPDGDLMFGYLADHQEPRLYTTRHGALYLGLLSSHGRCEVRVVSPFSMPLIADDVACGIDPRSYFDVAEAVRAAQKAGTPVGRTGFGSPLVVAPALAKARRAYAQPDYDPVRTAGWGDRGYAMSGDEAITFDETDKVTALARPLVAERSRIVAAAFAADGSGMAELEHSVALVDEGGKLTITPDTNASIARHVRADVAAVARSSFAKVGGEWWSSRGQLRPMGASSAPLLELPPDSAVMVGGRESGLVIEVGSGIVGVSRLDPKTRTISAVGHRATSLRVGLDAVERHAGGAIVAGVDSAARVVAFAIDSDGRIGPANDVGLAIDPKEQAVRLTALPMGGALVTDLGRHEIVWLDDGARPLAKAGWPAASPEARCVDGWTAPPLVPAPEPGQLVQVEGFAAPGTCVTGEIVWAPDGSLRWFGSTTKGPHTRAEVGRIQRASPLAASPKKTAPSFAALEPGAKLSCPSDMVAVRGRYCVDRFEGALAERGTGELVSPDVATTTNLMSVAMAEWSTRRERVGDLFARALPLPFVDPSQLGRNIDVLAVSRLDVRPSGYVTGLVAKQACEAAGKRLCSLDEWKTACRGEGDTLFPYGTDYEDGACNVNREAHPAGLLHGHSSLGHLDPRLNYASVAGSPLFHRTGQSPRCVSRWGADGIFDMVGNLDEWVDEGSGAFAGGFYSRGSKSGCGALVDNHPFGYLDYSTGVRCCKDASL